MAISDEIIKKLLREKEAFDRLIEGTNDQRYWRIKEIYMGRYQRLLRENNCL